MSDPTNTAAPMSPPDPRPDSGGDEPTSVLDSLNRIVELFRRELPPMGEAFTEMATELIADPAPFGLTAAQEIRARSLDLASQVGYAVNVVDLGTDGAAREFCRVAEVFAGWVQYGGGMTREQLVAAMAERGIPEPPAACPDPALHEDPDGLLLAVTAERDEARERVNRVLRDRDLVAEEFRRGLADLRAESTKAHARVAELERERHALIVERDTLAAQCMDAPAQVVLLERQRDEVIEHLDSQHGGPAIALIAAQVRAIYAEHGDEPSKVDVIAADGTHRYWSTHCRHADLVGGEEGDLLHLACSALQLAPGVPRKPAQCKTCAALCRCECHDEHGDDLGATP